VKDNVAFLGPPWNCEGRAVWLQVLIGIAIAPVVT